MMRPDLRTDPEWCMMILMGSTKQQQSVIRVPTQDEIDKGKAPRGWHMELVDDGCVFVRNGWHHTYVHVEGEPVITAHKGEWSWLTHATWPTKADM